MKQEYIFKIRRFVNFMPHFKKLTMYFYTPRNNEELIEILKEQGAITSKKVEYAMLTVDRAHYSNFSTYSYVDKPLSIGYGATISAPHMHAYALELLKDHLTKGRRALDVGCGSGYLTACMSVMLGPEGVAVGIDHIPELVTQSMHNVSEDKPGFLEYGRIILVAGDGRQGYSKFAPYSAIHVGAAATNLPSALLEQLDFGGRLVIPVGSGESQNLEVIDKDYGNRLRRRTLMSVRFVALTDPYSQVN